MITVELAQALLDSVETSHGRTSCSDIDVVNGFGSSAENWPRCNRCLLLEVVSGEVSPSDVTISPLSLTYENY